MIEIIEENSGNPNYIIRIQVNGMGIAYIKVYVTGNCQLCSFGNFQQILKYDIEKQIKILKSAFSKLTKKCCIIDIRQSRYDEFMKIFKKDEIILNQPYSSTNGSEMRMTIINKEKFLNRINNGK